MLTWDRIRRALSRWGWDVAGAALAVVYGLPSLAYPFARDHPVHWYIARRLLVDGEMPYVSGISTKPPAVFAVHALSQILFGDHQYSIRIVDLAFVLVAGVLVATFRARRRAPDGALWMPERRPGEIGAACLLVSIGHYTFFDFSDTAHPELWQAVFMLAPTWVVVRAPDGVLTARAAFAAGALACTAVMFKHTAVLSGVVAGIAVVVLAIARREPLRALRDAGAYTAGVAAVLALTILPFVLMGTFHAFWELMVDYILNHYAAGAGDTTGVPPWLTLDHGLPAALTALAGLAVGFGVAGAARDPRSRRVGLWILVITLTAAATVVIQKRALYSFTFTYYFVVMTPFLALCTAFGLRQAFKRNGVAQLGVALVLGAIFFAWAPKGTHNKDWNYRREWTEWIEVVRGMRTRESMLGAYYNSHIDSYVRQLRVAEVVLARKRDGDTLCVDGFIPILYHLTDMRCPSRFFVGDGAYSGPPEWRVEYETMMRERPPVFYVTFSDRPRKHRELEQLGYVRHRVADGGRPEYVVFERRVDGER